MGETMGITIARAREELGGTACGPLTRAGDGRFRRQTQRWFCTQLLARSGFDVVERLRSRLARWMLPGFPGRRARKVAHNLGRLRLLVPPRLRAAVLSTILNRWTTRRRMRHLRRQERCSCVLGCSETADDSVEHYVRCPVWRRWVAGRLGQDFADRGLEHALLATTMTDVSLGIQSAMVYVLYRTVNQLRRMTFRTAETRDGYIKDYMYQQLHEATRDSPGLRRSCEAAGFRRRPAEAGAPGGDRQVRRRADE